jgi:hypothetical protein
MGVFYDGEVLPFEVAFMLAGTVTCHFMCHFVAANNEFVVGDNYYQ